MKKFVTILLAGIMLILTPQYNAHAIEPQKDVFNLECKSAYLVENSTGKVLYEYNPHEKLAPASVTKIMTMLLTMEAVDSKQISLNDKVTASERAKAMGGSTMFLETGEIRTVEELLKGIAVESANDAAVALAEFLGGTQEAFAEKMNARAKGLGMNDTHFVNCMGFDDPEHYTSAYDIAIMSRELLKHPQILNYTSIWMETISEGRKEKFTLTNRNKMVRFYKGCDGLKTGFTSTSKYCISATAKRGDIRFISVIMGAPTIKIRNSQAGKLLDYGFAKYESVKVVKKGEEVGEIKVPKSKPEVVKIYAKDDLSLVVEKGSKEKFEKKVELMEDVKLPVKKGNTVGKIKAISGDKVFAEVDAVVECDIERMSVFDMTKKSFRYWLNIE